MALTVLDELHRFLDEHLPGGWGEAVRSGDSERVAVLAETLDNPAFVRLLGRAGWVAPQLDPAHGQRTGPRRTRGPSRRGGAGPLAGAPHTSGLGTAPGCADHRPVGVRADQSGDCPPLLVSGEECWCQLFSEPGAGSDLASLAHPAVRDGDEWVVNGQKVWTSAAHEADFGMLSPRPTRTSPKHQASRFVVDMQRRASRSGRCAR